VAGSSYDLNGGTNLEISGGTADNHGNSVGIGGFPDKI